jgi:arginine decarboxylase-like protein
MHDQFRRQINKRIKDGKISDKAGQELIEYYEDRIDAYTYLSPNGKDDKK